jgi:hypothetical protein
LRRPLTKKDSIEFRTPAGPASFAPRPHFVAQEKIGAALGAKYKGQDIRLQGAISKTPKRVSDTSPG